MKFLKKIAVVSASFLAVAQASYASASTIVCSLPVSAVGLTPDGSLFVNFNVQGTYVQWWLCNVSGSVSVTVDNTNTTITSSACQAMLSQFLTLRSSGTPAQVVFNGPASCTATALPGSLTFPNPYPAQFIF